MLTILLVDDDPEEFELFETAMAEVRPGVKLVHSDGCTDLLETVLKHNPDIVFIDINMPAINGIECLKDIRSRKEFRNLPIIMYSTSNSRIHIEQSFENKANFYIVKPHSLRGIRQALEKVIDIDWKSDFRPSLNNFVIA
jgi:CheY-like chemotaxis protein